MVLWMMMMMTMIIVMMKKMVGARSLNQVRYIKIKYNQGFQPRKLNYFRPFLFSVSLREAHF